MSPNTTPLPLLHRYWTINRYNLLNRRSESVTGHNKINHFKIENANISAGTASVKMYDLCEYYIKMEQNSSVNSICQVNTLVQICIIIIIIIIITRFFVVYLTEIFWRLTRFHRRRRYVFGEVERTVHAVTNVERRRFHRVRSCKRNVRNTALHKGALSVLGISKLEVARVYK